MPLLFNQSAHPNKNPSPARFRRRSFHLPSPDTFNAKRPPCLHRLSAPRLASRAHKRGLSPFAWVSPRPSRARQNHPPEISSRPCMAYLINIRIETTIDQDRQPLSFRPLLAFITISQAKLNVKMLRTLLKNTKNISINYLFEYIPNHKIGRDSDGCRLKIFFPFSLLFQFEKRRKKITKCYECPTPGDNHAMAPYAS